MTPISLVKNNAFGILSALQTLLERYPVLVKTDYNTGNTTFTFMLNLLRILGIDEMQILDWFSKLLADEGKNGVANGILSTIEAAIKAIILSTMKDTYTCAVDPTLPDELMIDPYGTLVTGKGIEVRLKDIDFFGVLGNCPTTEYGSVFYFDCDGYTPSNIYSSTDFNAYLWFVINKGAPWVFSERKKLIWDNRVAYRRKFKKHGCLNGESTTDLSTLKGKFVDASCENAPTKMVKGVGPKTEILFCEYVEYATGGTNKMMTDAIRVYLCADRYYRTSIYGTNKTAFDFATDYVLSLKLFDSKTIAANIINAILGILGNISPSFTIEGNILSKKITELVSRIMERDDIENTTTIDDCFYSFTNEEYDRMLEEATLNYNGKYQSKNENGEEISINVNEVLSELYKIGTAADFNERETVITETFKNIAASLSSTDETPEEDRFNFRMDIISEFIKQLCIQMALQILSPKVMLFFVINEQILNPGVDFVGYNFETFFNNFKNLFVKIIIKIKNLILQALYDFLVGQIKPLISLFVQRILIEKLEYHKMVLEDLLRNMVPFGIRRQNGFYIDDVNEADIVPPKEVPDTKSTCRTP